MKAKKINSKLQPVKMIHLLIDNNGTHQQALLGSQPTATIDCSSSCNYKKQSLTYRNNVIQKKNPILCSGSKIQLEIPSKIVHL